MSGIEIVKTIKNHLKVVTEERDILSRQLSEYDAYTADEYDFECNRLSLLNGQVIALENLLADIGEV